MTDEAHNGRGPYEAHKPREPGPTYSPGFMARLDARTGIARELYERYRELTNDLGGEAHLSYAQRSLVERALWLEYWLSRQEQTMVRGDFDAAAWIQGFNALQGVFAKLGLNRQARPVPNPREYLEARARERGES